MKFWPLFYGIIIAGYYDAWMNRWWLPVAAAACMFALLWALGSGTLTLVLGVALTLLLTPLCYVAVQLARVYLH